MTPGPTAIARRPDVAPVDDDEPLTDIERAVVKALVSVIVREIREKEAAAAVTTPDDQIPAPITSTRRRVR